LDAYDAALQARQHLEPAAPWTADEVFLMFMPSFHSAGAELMLQSRL
jgi:hypothetical protein